MMGTGAAGRRFHWPECGRELSPPPQARDNVHWVLLSEGVMATSVTISSTTGLLQVLKGPLVHQDPH